MNNKQATISGSIIALYKYAKGIEVYEMTYIEQIRLALLQKQFIAEIHRFNNAIAHQLSSEELNQIKQRIDKISSQIADLRATYFPECIKKN